MGAFEFYFSFYGLLLGLSVAQVASGVGHSVVLRGESRIGWLTPLLAAFLLLDIASFWLQAWFNREAIAVSYGSIYVGLAVALAYYLAAVLLFPVREGDWADLDTHYWRNKRLVVAGVLAANSIVFAEAFVRRGPPSGAMDWAATGLYFGLIAVLLVSRNRIVDGISLVILSAAYIAQVAVG